METNNKDEIECPRIFKVNTFEKFPDARITEILHTTVNDTNMQKLFGVISNGWPQKYQLDHRLTQTDTLLLLIVETL